MLSVQSSGETPIDGRNETMVVSVNIDVLCDTRTTQFGATVSSPIASFDVHFRSSSIDAG